MFETQFASPVIQMLMSATPHPLLASPASLEIQEPKPLKSPTASSELARPSRPAPTTCVPPGPSRRDSAPGAQQPLAHGLLLTDRRSPSSLHRTCPRVLSWPSLLPPPRPVTTTPSLPRARTPPESTGALTQCGRGRPGHPDPPPWGPG